MELTNEKRFSAILALQNKQMKHLQGSYLYEIYDKAIDLALNPKRQVNDFFTHNLFRDAKRILARRKKRIPEFAKLTVIDEEENVVDLIEGLPGDGLTPLDEIILREYYWLIYAKCNLLHVYALDVLDFLLAGVDIKNTVRILGLSESLVKKIRVQLKSAIYLTIKKLN